MPARRTLDYPPEYERLMSLGRRRTPEQQAALEQIRREVRRAAYQGRYPRRPDFQEAPAAVQFPPAVAPAPAGGDDGGGAAAPVAPEPRAPEGPPDGQASGEPDERPAFPAVVVGAADAESGPGGAAAGASGSTRAAVEMSLRMLGGLAVAYVQGAIDDPSVRKECGQKMGAAVEESAKAWGEAGQALGWFDNVSSPEALVIGACATTFIGVGLPVLGARRVYLERARQRQQGG